MSLDARKPLKGLCVYVTLLCFALKGIHRLLEDTSDFPDDTRMMTREELGRCSEMRHCYWMTAMSLGGKEGDKDTGRTGGKATREGED